MRRDLGGYDTRAEQVKRVADEMLAGSDWRTRLLGAGAERALDTASKRHDRDNQEDQWIRTLHAVGKDLPIGTPSWLTKGVILHELESRVRSRVARLPLLEVNHMTGWHLAVGQLASTLLVSTPSSRDTAVAYARAMPSLIQSRIKELRSSLHTHACAPTAIVWRVTQQLEDLLSGNALDSPALRSPASAFSTTWKACVEEYLRPSLRAYHDFLRDDYMRAARDDGRLASLEHGEEIYQGQVFRFTSVDRPLPTLLEGVSDHIAELDARIAPICNRLFPGTPLPEAKRALRTDGASAQRWNGKAVQQVRDAVDHVKAQLSAFFFKVPEVALVIDQMTTAEERMGAAAYYQSAESDRPARLVVNATLADSLAPWEMTSLGVHEGYPGHHLERSYGDCNPERHPAITDFQVHAYREGWAIYAEDLAASMNVYRSDFERAGVLLREIENWVGHEIDISLHMGLITRDEAVRRKIECTGRPREIAELHIDRQLAIPGQILSYTLGPTEFRKLRTLAEVARGKAFDLREFHDVLLRDGSVTLSMLRAKIEAAFGNVDPFTVSGYRL